MLSIKEYQERCREIGKAGEVQNVVKKIMRDHGSEATAEETDINQKLYDEFVNYLQELNSTANSVGKHIRILKLMLDEAPRELREQANYEKSHVFTEDTSSLQKELGDIMWYVATLATEAGLDLEVIMTANLEKLASRKQHGVIQGNGDNR